MRLTYFGRCFVFDLLFVICLLWLGVCGIIVYRLFVVAS